MPISVETLPKAIAVQHQRRVLHAVITTFIQILFAYSKCPTSPQPVRSLQAEQSCALFHVPKPPAVHGSTWNEVDRMHSFPFSTAFGPDLSIAHVDTGMRCRRHRHSFHVSLLVPLELSRGPLASIPRHNARRT